MNDDQVFPAVPLTDLKGGSPGEEAVASGQPPMLLT